MPHYSMLRRDFHRRPQICKYGSVSDETRKAFAAGLADIEVFGRKPLLMPLVHQLISGFEVARESFVSNRGVVKRLAASFSRRRDSRVLSSALRDLFHRKGGLCKYPGTAHNR
jgi:hypothetical protein